MSNKQDKGPIEAEKQFEHLSNCKCCNRHQINRPQCLEIWNETPHSIADRSQQHCICDCRHKLRFICRDYCGWKTEEDLKHQKTI